MTVSEQHSSGVDLGEYVSGTWDIDPLHSDVSFVVRHLGLTRFRRSFTKFAGVIITKDNPLESSVDATIEVSSFDTGLEAFNKSLLSKDFLDAETHPTATFRSTGITAQGDRYAVGGELTLRGITRAVPLDLELLGFGEGIKGETKAAFSAGTTIDRSDFGITFDGRLPNGRLIVGHEVRILLEIEAILR